jgi:hypothetical protein
VRPENGHLLGVALRRYSASELPFLSFTRVTFDARGYRRLLAQRGVLAVRGLVSSDLTGENGATPFYLQQSLGGGETLRGFHSYRFPDRALAHLSVEYRWRAHRYVEIAPFLDTGTVAPALVAAVARLIQDEPRSGHSRPHQDANHRPARLGSELGRTPDRPWRRACFLDPLNKRVVACPLNP